MLMVMWFWAVTSALMPGPAQIAALHSQALETQRAVEDAARPLMALGWADEDDVAIF
ncbi:MAG: hypothetical protein R3C16_11145 [Hyphomonadaceae bacterium]